MNTLLEKTITASHALRMAIVLLLSSLALATTVPASEPVDLHDWLFDDPAGTALSDTLNSVNPSVTWSGNMADSVTTGDGVFRIRRDGGTLNRRFDLNDALSVEQVRVQVEIAGWDLRNVTGSQPSIRFELMDGPASTTPSAITAGFHLERQSGGDVTLRAIAFGTAFPGGTQSEPEPLFGSLQTDPLTFVTEYDQHHNRYRISYRVGSGPWQVFFEGYTSGVREAISFRMQVSGDFNGLGQDYFDLDGLTVSTAPGAFDADIVAGPGGFVHQFTGMDVPVPVWTYLPADAPADPPILFLCHGMGRAAGSMRNRWIEQADLHGYMIVAPEFSEEYFPGSRVYNRGNLFDSEGAPNPQEEWSFNVIEDVFDDVLQRTNSQRESYYIFGHSAGSQFVHRLLFFIPDLRVDRAVMGNAGLYSFPDTSIDYPWGLANTPVSLDDVEQAIAGPHIVIVGARDNDPNHDQLCNSTPCKAQGAHRVARATNFYDSCKAFAVDRSSAFGMSLGYAPDVPHSDGQLAPYVSNWLFAGVDWVGRGGLLYNEPDQQILHRDFDDGLPAPANTSAPWEDDIIFPAVSVLFSNAGTPSTYRIANTSSSGSINHWRDGPEATVGFIGGRASDAVGDIHYGMRLTNNSGTTLNQFTLLYEGAQFRNSNSGVQNTIEVTWRAGTPGDLMAGVWNQVPELTFDAPHVGDGVSGGVNIDPYHPDNRETIGPVTITGLQWLPGEDLWIRWTDFNASGVDHGVGIDNILFSATAGSTTTMHVADIQANRVNQGGGQSKAEAVVTVVDAQGAPVSGALVTVAFTGAIVETRSGTTDVNGVVTILTNGSAGNPAKTTACVDDINHSSLTYNPENNVADCDNT